MFQTSIWFKNKKTNQKQYQEVNQNCHWLYTLYNLLELAVIVSSYNRVPIVWPSSRVSDPIIASSDIEIRWIGKV